MAMNFLGDFTTANTVYVFFNTFDSNDPSASVTMTGLALGDILIYKNGSVTQRSSTAGFTLLDTDGIDFDGKVGIHGFSIDLSDDDDAGFFAAGAEYAIVVDTITVDAGAIRFVAASFSIERAGGALALLKGTNSLANIEDKIDIIDTNVDDLETAIITNAAGVDIAADIIALKAETVLILDDTDLIDDGTSGLAKIATDVAATLVDTAVIGVLGAGLTNINLPNQTMNITGDLSGSVGSVTGAVGSVSGNVGGSIGGDVNGSIAGNVNGSVGSLAAQAKLDVNAEADTALTDSGIEADLDNATDGLTALKAAIDALNDYDPTAAMASESYAAKGAVPSPNQALLELVQRYGESSNAGTTRTTKKIDGTTTAMTHTYDDATSPTSVTRAT